VNFGFAFIIMFDEYRKEKSSKIKEWLEEKSITERYVVVVDEKDIGRDMIIDEKDIVIDEEEAFIYEDVVVDEKHVVIEKDIVIDDEYDEYERRYISKRNKRNKKIALVIFTLIAGADIRILEVLGSNLQICGLKFNLKLPKSILSGKVIGLIIEDIPGIIIKVHCFFNVTLYVTLF
jgi:hypothetical protein